MSDEIWRKECRAYLSTLPGYARAGFSSKQAEMVYIEAKKSSQLKIEELEHKLELAIKALESIAKNTCCTPCQEAKKVAEKSLEQLK